jgi:hypothetical protein
MISHFLHVHTARPHLLESSFDSIGIHQLGYRPYGPDIAASEFELFAYVNIKLEEMFFDTPMNCYRAPGLKAPPAFDA